MAPVDTPDELPELLPAKAVPEEMDVTVELEPLTTTIEVRVNVGTSVVEDEELLAKATALVFGR